jgi:hypothetical protein
MSGGPLSVVSVERFDQDLLSKLCADAQPHIADLADDIRMLGQKPDFLLFAKTHLTKPMRDLGRGRKLLDANGSACANVA